MFGTTRWWLPLMLAACAVDRDGDGVTSDQDCDDSDPTMWQAFPFYEDEDGDGVGARETTACEGGPGLAFSGGDCDDEDWMRSPLLEERCNHIDDDCDGAIDEELLTDVYWWDIDGDLYGDPLAPVTD